MHFEPGAGSVLYRSRMNKKQGGNFAALSPTDFIAAVTQHISRQRLPARAGGGRGASRKTLLKAMSRIVRPTSAQWRGLIAKIWEADPLTCPDCGAEMRILAFIEEDRRHRKNSQASGPTPDASRGPPLQEPVYEPIYNDLPAVEEEDGSLPALLSAQRAFRDGPFLLPGARPGHPEAQNAPEPAREAQNGVDSRSGILQTPKELVESPFPLRNQPARRRSAPGPKKFLSLFLSLIPIPKRSLLESPVKTELSGRAAGGGSRPGTRATGKDASGRRPPCCAQGRCQSVEPGSRPLGTTRNS